MVKNPNAETRERYPEVSFSTAMDDEGFQQQVRNEFAEWKTKREKSGEDFADRLRKLVPKGTLSANGERRLRTLTKAIDPKKMDAFLKKHKERDVRDVLRAMENYALEEMRTVAPFLKEASSFRKRWRRGRQLVRQAALILGHAP